MSDDQTTLDGRIYLSPSYLRDLAVGLERNILTDKGRKLVANILRTVAKQEEETNNARRS